MEVPGTDTVGGVRLAVGPAGVTVAVQVTGPVKPLLVLSVMVEVPLKPASRLSEVGEAPTEKSTTLTLMVALWVRLPLVPVTVTT